MDSLSKIHTTQGWVRILSWLCLFHKHKLGNNPVVQVILHRENDIARNIETGYRNEMLQNSIPDIQWTNLDTTILLKAMGAVDSS